MSALIQERELFDHLVGTDENRLRQHHSNFLRGFRIDREAEIGWLQEGDFRGILTGQYLAHLSRQLAKRIKQIPIVRHEPSGDDKIAERKAGRDSSTRGQINQNSGIGQVLWFI